MQATYLGFIGSVPLPELDYLFCDRFVIPGRVLRLHVPLDMLRSDDSLDDKNDWLDQLIQEKLANRRLRYYQEPVVLLDE